MSEEKKDEARAGHHTPLATSEAAYQTSNGKEHTAPSPAAQREIAGPDPRSRRNARGGTSQAAAQAVKRVAAHIRGLVLAEIELKPSTPEQVFERLKSQGVDTVLGTVRPRCTDLANLGLIRDSGLRGRSESGKCRSIVWRATTPHERADFAVRKAAKAEGAQ